MEKVKITLRGYGSFIGDFYEEIVSRKTLPEGVYAYDILYNKYKGPAILTTMSYYNRFGTVVTNKKIPNAKDGVHIIDIDFSCFWDVPENEEVEEKTEKKRGVKMADCYEPIVQDPFANSILAEIMPELYD